MSEVKTDSVVNVSGDNDSGIDLSTNDVVKIKTANSERMRIDSSGRVGIGATSMDEMLLIQQTASGANTDLTIRSANDGGSRINFGDQSSDGEGRIDYDHSSNFLAITTNSSERMRLLNDGKVVIGDTSASSTLQVKGNGARFVNSADTDALHLFEFDGSNNASMGLYDASGNNKVKIASSGTSFISGGGNTGFGDETSPPATVSARHNGTSQPAAQFKVTNTSFSNDAVQIVASRDGATTEFNMLTVFDNNSDIKALIRPDGDFENANNSYNVLSDQRYKENIADASSQWDDIKAVQIRKYNLIGNSATHIGVIAQELETAGMNGLVYDAPEYGEYENENGDTVLGPLETTRKGVKSSILYMKAVKALQEAMARIETLETKVEALETKVAALEAGE